MNYRVVQTIKNMQNIPQIRPVDPYPISPLYADNDGLWYYYTIWHLEQIARLQSE